MFLELALQVLLAFLFSLLFVRVAKLFFSSRLHYLEAQRQTSWDILDRVSEKSRLRRCTPNDKSLVHSELMNLVVTTSSKEAGLEALEEAASVLGSGYEPLIQESREILEDRFPSETSGPSARQLHSELV